MMCVDYHWDDVDFVTAASGTACMLSCTLSLSRLAVQGARIGRRPPRPPPRRHSDLSAHHARLAVPGRRASAIIYSNVNEIYFFALTALHKL